MPAHRDSTIARSRTQTLTNASALSALGHADAWEHDEAEERRPLFLLRRGANLMGRHPSCTILLRDLTVSRRHAEFVAAKETLVIRDLNSRNGTLVNRQAIREAELAPGDEIQVGSFVFEVWTKGLGLVAVEDLQNASTLRRGRPWDSIGGWSCLLTPARQRVLSSLLDGLTEKDIAARLDISPHTVHNHIKAIYRSFDVTTRSELLSLFLTAAAEQRLQTDPSAAR
jgi:DNA-binding CsgD family transcriptional regulator